MATNSRENIRRFFRDNLEIIVITFVVALALRLFVISAYRVPNSSMMPTFESGDFVFGFRLPYGVRVPVLGTKIATDHLPERGDLVIVQIIDESMETTTLLKRVVGLPGDRIEIKAGRLTVNGIAMKYEPIVSAPNTVLNTRLLKEIAPTSALGVSHEILAFDKKLLGPEDDEDDFEQDPEIVPPNQVYLLSDDRTKSDDSRQLGAVAVSDIEARAFLIWMSFNWQNANLPSVRWDRVLKKID